MTGELAVAAAGAALAAVAFVLGMALGVRAESRHNARQNHPARWSP